MSGFLIIYVLVIVAAIAAAGFMAVRKGENQVVIRTSIILVLSSCYLMWAITYLAQLHPLIKPRRADLKPHHVGPESDYLF